MNEKEFSDLVKRLVMQYTNDHGNEKITEADVYIVWECKILQNNKALASTTLSDGMYYELTYNGVKKELYFDAYKKQENICIEM